MQIRLIQVLFRPLVKNCSGAGATECRTEYETSCSTKFLDTSLVDTSCIKVSIIIIMTCDEHCVPGPGEILWPGLRESRGTRGV